MALLALASLLGRPGRWRSMLGAVVAATALLSCLHNAQQESLWTKGISYHLPQVAQEVNRSTSPLIVGNRERHNPGNLLALSTLLRDDASIQFLAMQDPTPPLPPGFESVYLFSPTPTYREELVAMEGVRLERLVHDLHLELWRVVR